MSNTEYGTISLPTTLTSHIVCIFVAVALTVIASIYFEPTLITANQHPLFTSNTHYFTGTLALVVNFILMLVVMIYLNAIASRFSITTLLSLSPTLFFLILQCSNPNIITQLQPGISGALIIALTIFYLLDNYGVKRVESVVFGITLLVLLLSLVWINIIFFIPILWIGLMQLNMFGARSFTSSLMAVGAMAILLYTINLTGWIEFNPQLYFENIKNTLIIDDYSHVGIDTLYNVLYLLPIFIVVILYNLSAMYSDSRDKISIKRYIMVINTIWFATIILMLLNPSRITDYIPIFNSMSTLLAARYFNTIKSRIKLRFLILIIATYIIIFTLWIW